MWFYIVFDFFIDKIFSENIFINGELFDRLFYIGFWVIIFYWFYDKYFFKFSIFLVGSYIIINVML